MVNDFKKITLKQLDLYEYNALLLDLIDERFHLGVVNNSIVTRSNEFISSKISPERIISTFSDEFFELWARGITLFLKNLTDKKVILPKVYWASQAIGKNSPSFDSEQLQQIVAHNNKLMKMYRYLEAQNFVNLKIIDIDKSLLIANADHQWGLSPFHYIDEYYLFMQKQLKELV